MSCKRLERLSVLYPVPMHSLSSLSFFCFLSVLITSPLQGVSGWLLATFNFYVSSIPLLGSPLPQGSSIPCLAFHSCLTDEYTCHSGIEHLFNTIVAGCLLFALLSHDLGIGLCILYSHPLWQERRLLVGFPILPMSFVLRDIWPICHLSNTSKYNYQDSRDIVFVFGFDKVVIAPLEYITYTSCICY